MGLTRLILIKYNIQLIIYKYFGLSILLTYYLYITLIVYTFKYKVKYIYNQQSKKLVLIKKMITIQETQDKLLDLINSRLSVRQLGTPGVQNPMRMLGERMLNMFAGQMISDSMMAEQKEDIKEELLETVMSSLALAGLLGIDLQRELMDAIALLEQVTAEGA